MFCLGMNTCTSATILYSVYMEKNLKELVFSTIWGLGTELKPSDLATKSPYPLNHVADLSLCVS